jgi:hypothetical protein
VRRHKLDAILIQRVIACVRALVEVHHTVVQQLAGGRGRAVILHRHYRAALAALDRRGPLIAGRASAGNIGVVYLPAIAAAHAAHGVGQRTGARSLVLAATPFFAAQQPVDQQPER